MGSRILKRSSFALLRTNPKLSTNVKLVVDSVGGVFLESIDANPTVARSVFKGFRVNPAGSYAYDLSRFWNQGGLLVKDSAYFVYERDASAEVKDRYKNQFDETYWAGVHPKNSKLYDEEYAAFAPLWLERDSVPDLFVIFKMDGPVTVNANDPSFNGVPDKDVSDAMANMVSDPAMFFSNVVSKARIVKTFDLTENSAVGRYIRSHLGSAEFPEAPLYASMGKGQMTYWNGIAVDNGGFASRAEELYPTVGVPDKTVMEFDDYVTCGFQRHSVACANLLNLEFLFDDPVQEKYRFSRYFGLYCTEAEVGRFVLDGDRLYADRDRETTQLLRPSMNLVGHPGNLKDQVQSNVLGVKLYPAAVISATGVTGIDSGRLLTLDEVRRPRFPYVKDAKGEFHSVSDRSWWSDYTVAATGPTAQPVQVHDEHFVRIKDVKVNLRNFTGYEGPFTMVPGRVGLVKGRPGFSVKVLANPESGDSVRVKVTDAVGASSAVDGYTVTGDVSLPEGHSVGLLFSTNGTPASVASAMSRAINFVKEQVGEQQIFESIAQDDEVLVFTRTTSQTWNSVTYSVFSSSPNFPFQVFGASATPTSSYLPSPVAFASPQSGLLVEGRFTGGNDNPYARCVVDRADVGELVGEGLFVKTSSGFGKVGSLSMYFDEPVYDSKGKVKRFDGYGQRVVVNLSDSTQNFDLGHTRKVSVYRHAQNSTGFLGVYPVKDFDFDFRSVEYSRGADSSPAGLYGWYSGGTGGTVSPVFDYGTLGASSAAVVDGMVGPSSSVYVYGFQSLQGIVDELADEGVPVANEYDRLKENSLQGLSLSSRVVPFINKWVYDDLGVDVRENGYRLNADQSFGHLSFSPSFDHLERDRRFYTHEWLYLQTYPPYMGFAEKAGSFSYFDGELNFPAIPLPTDSNYVALCAALTSATGSSANLLSLSEDYFVSYFTRETVDGVPVPRDFKYAYMSHGSPTRHAECMFRGVKVELRERAEFSPIQWNKDNLRTIPGVRFNGYKFTAVLAFSGTGNQVTFVKNDRWKTVTMVVQAEADGPLLQYYDAGAGATGRFFDRSSLYSLQHKVTVAGPTVSYADRDVSGGVVGWLDNGVEFTVIGGSSIGGVFPNFSEEVSLNENGSYNSIRAAGPSYSFVFEDIYDLTTTTFKCRRISSTTFTVNPLVPNGSRSLYPDIYYTMWAGVWFLRDGYVSDLRNTVTYLGGGYNGYTDLFNSLSFGELAMKVNRGDPSVKYVSVDSSGAVSYDTFCVELVRPDYLMKAAYMRARKVQNRPIDLQNSTETVGYELAALPRTEMSEIARYRGGYAPKVRDVLLFCDSAQFIADSLDYRNTEVFVGVTAIGRSFAAVENMYFNKVNPENPNIILRGVDAVFPDIGEIAIDYGNKYVFGSSWDPAFYRKYVKKDQWTPVLGTREPAERKSFMGSKVIAIPDVVRIETFPGGVVSLGDVGSVVQAGGTDANVVLSDRSVSGRRTLEFSVLVTTALEKWLIDDGFGADFYRYVDPAYSFGERGAEDDVRLYIRENVYDRYSVKEVVFFEKTLVGVDAPLVVTGLTDAQKAAAGYRASKSFVAVPLQQDGLDLKLIHTLPADRRTSVAFTVVLTKK